MPFRPVSAQNLTLGPFFRFLVPCEEYHFLVSISVACGNSSAPRPRKDSVRTEKGCKTVKKKSPGHRPTGVLDPSSYLFLFRLPTFLLTFCLFELVNYRFSSYHGKRARKGRLPGTLVPENRHLELQPFALDRLDVTTWADFSDFLKIRSLEVYFAGQ